MVGCTRRPGKRAEIRFADPPWNEWSDEWQVRDRQVPAEHPARAVVEAMKQVNMTPLFDLYVGAGSPPIRPDVGTGCKLDRRKTEGDARRCRLCDGVQSRDL